jgi:excisionase family DNA binding protein
VSDLARLVIDDLDDDDLARLAARIAPLLAPPAEDDRPWMDSHKAAAYLGVSLDALHKLTAARKVPCHQTCPGAKLYFRRSELDAWRGGQ